MPSRFSRLLTAAASLAVTLIAVFGSQNAAAFEPAPWTKLLPAPLGFTPTNATLCQNGSITCVDDTMSQLQAQLDPLVATCDHELMFNFVYLRITQAYRDVATVPGYFHNAPYVNQEDAVFASYYLSQYNAWNSGRPQDVSPAWRIAFDAADHQRVSGLGDIFLAINAHIMHDEAFVLDQMGLGYPDGVSAKGDYDHDNVWLSAAQTSTITEVARRFDPTVTQPVILTQPPFSTLEYQLIAAWREAAWRYAEQLKLAEAAHKALLYRAVQAEIDAVSVANANAILLATANSPQQTAARNAYCQAHRHDA